MKSFLPLVSVALVASSSSSTGKASAFIATTPASFNHRATSSPGLFVSLSTPQAAYSPTSTANDEAESSLLPWDHEQVVTAVFADDHRPVILFDGVCNLCNGGVNFALDNDKDGNFRFASLQSQIGQSLLVSAGRKPTDHSSIVLVRHNGRAYFESDAILRISAGLEGHLFQSLSHIGKHVPRLIRDFMYHVVSENRHLLGEADQCRLDFDGEFDDRFMAEHAEEPDCDGL